MEVCIKGTATGVARIMSELFALACAVCLVLTPLLGFPLKRLGPTTTTRTVVSTAVAALQL